jgi:hypothetical protein
MNKKDDASRFTIRDGEDEAESIYIADAENLRIEKLSTRVTLVAVLIPCLLVIVLAIAYLDIKTRVISTQNTGSMGVQKLSKDLESRFSNLSLKQAKMEVQLDKHAQTLETATAAMQVNLKKATTELKRVIDGKLDPTELKAFSISTEASIADLQKDMADLNAAFNKFDEELAAQILLMAKGLNKDQDRLSEIDKKTRQLEKEKLSKESMDLALGLERLALQEMIKDRIREIDKKMAILNKRVEVLSQRLDKQSRQAPPVPSSAVTPTPPPPPARSPSTPSGSANIVEQTIN